MPSQAVIMICPEEEDKEAEDEDAAVEGDAAEDEIFYCFGLVN